MLFQYISRFISVPKRNCSLVMSSAHNSNPTVNTRSRAQLQATAALLHTGDAASSSLIVQHNPDKGKFFIKLNAEEAFVQYSVSKNVIKLEETEVPEAFGGRGVGKLLAKAAFDYSVENKYQIDVICTFLQHYHQKYGPQYEPYIIKN